MSFREEQCAGTTTKQESPAAIAFIELMHAQNELDDAVRQLRDRLAPALSSSQTDKATTEAARPTGASALIESVYQRHDVTTGTLAVVRDIIQRLTL